MLAQPALIEPESVSSKPAHDPSFLEPELEEDSQGIATRKRHISSNSENERQLKRARLTQGNLTLFDKMTKKNVDTKASLLSGSTADSSKTQTKTISTTSSGFEVQATKNGILLSTNSKAPKNAEDLVGRLNQSRDTASPTESIFGDYVDTVTKVPNEATTSHETVPLLKGYRDRAYSRAWNQAFTAYPKNVGFNNGLSAPQPDFVQGFRQLEFEPFPIGEELDSAVLFNDDQNSIALPHFAGEWKGPGNDMDQAALQSAYDGAALVHSRNEALAYVEKSDPAGHASVLTVTTDGRAVNVFGHYVAPSAGGDKLKYHQYRLTTAHMDESYEDFKRGGSSSGTHRTLPRSNHISSGGSSRTTGRPNTGDRISPPCILRACSRQLPTAHSRCQHSRTPMKTKRPSARSSNLVQTSVRHHLGRTSSIRRGNIRSL